MKARRWGVRSTNARQIHPHDPTKQPSNQPTKQPAHQATKQATKRNALRDTQPHAPKFAVTRPGALWKHVHPVTLIQLANHVVHQRLVNAFTALDGHDLLAVQPTRVANNRSARRQWGRGTNRRQQQQPRSRKTSNQTNPNQPKPNQPKPNQTKPNTRNDAPCPSAAMQLPQDGESNGPWHTLSIAQAGDAS